VGWYGAGAAFPREPPTPASSLPGRGVLRDRRLAEAAGRRGERLAGWWLRLKGWRILDRRVRTPAGEVDLVAKKGNLVAFVEVKARATAAELDFAIDEPRLARVARAAEYLMPRYAGPGDDIRVDVILIAPGTRPRHIENAWIG
jgi:putative endonuclease